MQFCIQLSKDTIGTTVRSPAQQNLCNKDTIGTTVRSPVQQNLCNKDTIRTTVRSPVQQNLCNKDTIETTVSSPVCGGVLILEGLNIDIIYGFKCALHAIGPNSQNSTFVVTRDLSQGYTRRYVFKKFGN